MNFLNYRFDASSNPIRCILLLLGLFFITSQLHAQEPIPGGAGPNQPSKNALPLSLPDSSAQPLRTLWSNPLQNALLKEVNGHSDWKRLINNERMAVGLVDLRDVGNIKFAHINGNRMMYAASLPKIAILLAAMDAIENNELEETPDVRSDLRQMISHSNNQAATRMIDRLSYEKIESVMEDPSYQLYDKDFGGGLWVGKRYASAGRRYPDPMEGLSHAATAAQVCRYYYLMATGQLVTAERSAQILDIMENSALHHKLVHTLDEVAPNARVFRKSGTWRNYHSDSALVWGDPSQRYILVALIQDNNGAQIIRDLVRPVEKVLSTVNYN